MMGTAGAVAGKADGAGRAVATSRGLSFDSPVEGLPITDAARVALARAGIRDVGALVEMLEPALRCLGLGEGDAASVTGALRAGADVLPEAVCGRRLRALCASCASREFAFDGFGRLLFVPAERRDETVPLAEGPVDGLPVGELGLTVPILRALAAHGVETAGQLARMTDDELLGVRGIGEASLRRVRERLAEAACSLMADASAEAPEPPEVRTEGLDGLCEAAVKGAADAYAVCVARSYRVCARTFVAAFAYDAQDAVGTSGDADAYRDVVLGLVVSSPALGAACLSRLEAWRDACRMGRAQEAGDSMDLPEGGVWDRAAMALAEGDPSCRYDARARRVTLEPLRLDEWLDGWLGRAVECPRRDVVDAYLDLGSYPACARALGISRARAQILVGRALRHAPVLAEDRLRHLLESYRLPLKDFRALTGEGVRTFSYLRATRTRGRLPPVRPLEEAISDPEVPEPVREAVRRRLGRAFVEVGDLLVPRRRREVVRHVARTRASESAVTMGELWDAYGAFLSEHGLAGDDEFWFGGVDAFDRFVTRDCPDVMRVSRAADARCGGSVRYYDPTGRDFPALVAAIEGAGYGDLACSSALLMRDPRLRGVIGALDVRNGYELHHVLARCCGPIDGLRVGKAPSLFFGDGDHESQARALVAEVGPVAGPELSREYERRYGTRAGSFAANVLPKIRDWCEDGVYRAPGGGS